MPYLDCIICGMQAQAAERVNDTYNFDCPRCGTFAITGTAHTILLTRMTSASIAVFSFVVRQMQMNQARPTLDSSTVDWLWKNGKLPNAREQSNNLILWLGRTLKTGETTTVEFIPYQSIVGVDSPEGVVFLLSRLARKNLIDVPAVLLKVLEESPRLSIGHVALSLEGWDRYYELQLGVSDSRRAFMAMQYNDAELDNVVEHCLRPAVSAAGFDLILLNDPLRQKAGLIDDRLRVEIRTSRFLIADLTHHNRGAYWEAGFAEGLGKPVIYTCKQSVFEDPEKVPHFDTNHHLTVLWDRANLSAATEELKAVIRATLPTEAQMRD
jgi:hypothetical protein